MSDYDGKAQRFNIAKNNGVTRLHEQNYGLVNLSPTGSNIFILSVSLCM